MPLHLLPSRSSRRHFLRNLAVAGGVGATGLSLTRSGWSAESKGDADSGDRWALLSDTHIAADPKLVSRQGTCMAETLAKVVSEVVEEADQLDGVLIDGDCAFDDGQPGDYTTLARLLEPLTQAGLPIHFTLGNHDDRDHFLAGMSEEGTEPSPVVDGKHVSVVEGKQVNWVMLDSLRFVNQVEGEFGEAQLAWLDRWLSQNSEKPALLVGHHYPQVFRTDVIPSDEEIRISGLVDSEPFLEIAHRHPQVKGYLYGHSHDWKVATDPAGVHQVNLPPTAYVFRPDRPNGWVRATVSAKAMTLELRALDPEHPQHGKTKTLAWR